MSEDQKSKNTTRGFLCCVIVNFVFIFLISGFAYCERQANQRTHAAKEYSGQVPNTDTNNLYSDYLLQAQQDVALWNFGMFIIASGALVATVVGIYFIARTLDATRAAVKEAEDATQAANEAVAVTREIGEAQAAAYITTDNIKLHIDPTNGTPSARFLYRNTGQTPAIDIWIKWDLFIRNAHCQIPIFMNDSQVIRFADVGAGQEIDKKLQFCERNVGTDDHEAIIDSKKWIIVAGTISYEDVFGDRYENDFKFRYFVDDWCWDEGEDGWLFEEKDLQICPEGNRFRKTKHRGKIIRPDGS